MYDFGVEVTGPFECAGEVFSMETPTGDAVVAVYRGPYDGLPEAYDAIGAWMAVHARALPRSRCGTVVTVSAGSTGGSP